MVGNKELEIGLKAMARDFRLPGDGRMKLSKLVAGHLKWFNAAERRGMTWGDMTKALAAAGVTGRGGKPISVGTLSSTVWRVRTNEAEANGPRERERPRPPQSLPSGQRRSTRSRGTGQRQQDKRGATPETEDGTQVGQPASKRPATRDRAVRANKDVLAFMDRARAVRRRSEDD